MKKCMKCDLIFQLEERTRCLYCNTLLVPLDPEEEPEEGQVFEETAGGKALAQKKAIIAQMIRDRRVKGHGRMQYVVGSYFRTRTFHFMYGFSRNELLMGQGFSRFMVQPLNTSHFFIIPWVFIDFFDSLFVRMIYSGYCPRCGWKYNKLVDGREHHAKKCAYCREYSLVIEDILSGRITQSERIFKKQSFEACAAGERSAYHDLCSQNKLISKLSDIFCIWFSVTLMLTLIVGAIWPIFSFLLKGLDLPDMDLR